MGNEPVHTLQTTGGVLAHQNIKYAHAYHCQDDGVHSSLPYLPSSTSPYPYAMPADHPTAFVDLISTRASAHKTNPASIVSITALPPLTTDPHHARTKFPHHRHLNIIFLAPLFAALGILLGVGAATLWFKFRPLDLDTGSGMCRLGRRRNGRASRNNLELGPVRVSAPESIDVEDDGVYSNRNRGIEQVTLFDVGAPSKSTVHDQAPRI